MFDISISDWADGTECFSSSLRIVAPWQDCLIDWLDVGVVSRTLAGCRKLGMGTSGDSTQGKAKSCTWGATASSRAGSWKPLAGSSSAELLWGPGCVFGKGKQQELEFRLSILDHGDTVAGCESWLPSLVQPQFWAAWPQKLCLEQGLRVGSVSFWWGSLGWGTLPWDGRSLWVLGAFGELGSHPGFPKAAPPVLLLRWIP